MQRRLMTLLVVLRVGAGTASAAATTPPRNTVRPTISGTARQGETLTADPGSWSGTQPMTFAFQWRRCDTNGASCANIIGATTKTCTVTSVDVGNVLREAVTISEQRLPAFSGADVRTVATVQTAADGSFNLAVRPLIRTLFRGNDGQTTSNTVSVNVRPRLSLRRIGSHRFALTAMAARSFAGRYAVLQRWIPRRHRWISVRRVFFTRAFSGVSPTITSRAVFRARFGGVRIRAYVRQSQLSPGYVPGVSNVASA